MRSFNKEEYLKLCEQIAQEKYDTDTDEDFHDILSQHWMPSEPEAKKKIAIYDSNQIINLTNAKINKIEEAIHKYQNIEVGNFLIRITSYHGEPNVPVSANLVIYEYKNKIYGNNNSKIPSKINPIRDSRFEKRSWLSYFDTYGGTKIPIKDIPNIIRWLQAINKMPAFL